MTQQRLSNDNKTSGQQSGFMRALDLLNFLLGALEKWIIIICVLTMAVLMSAHVVGNLLFQRGIPGTYEVTEMLIVVITFIGVGYAARHARHISMSAIYEQLSGRLRKVLLIILCLGTAALMFYFAYLSVDYVSALRERGRSSASLHIPLWIVYLALPVGFILAGVQYLLITVRNLVSKDIYRSFTEKEEYEALPLDDNDQSHAEDSQRGA